MAMEQRGRNTYYYRKERHGQQVRSLYLGNGYTAQLIAACEAARLQAEAGQRALLRADHAEHEALATQLRTLAGAVRQMTAAVLYANGYHQHKRQWRKYMQQPHLYDSAPRAPLASATNATSLQEGRAALRAAFTLAEIPSGLRGKALERAKADAQLTRQKAVRAVLEAYPDLWSQVRRMLATAEGAITQAVTDDGLSREFLEFALKGIRRDLGYQDAPLLEKLLIEHISIAWLDLDVTQQLYARNALGSHTLTQGTYWDRRLSGAQLRYLRASEALARVRRLASPVPLQVNIGGQQVNVAGAPASS